VAAGSRWQQLPPWISELRAFHQNSQFCVTTKHTLKYQLLAIYFNDQSNMDIAAQLKSISNFNMVAEIQNGGH
jgi:hypothetical protein